MQSPMYPSPLSAVPRDRSSLASQLTVDSSHSSTRFSTLSVGPSASGSAPSSKRTSLIYDRPINKTKNSEVALSAWEFWFSEIVQYTQGRVAGIADFEKKLNTLGYRVGLSLVELYPLRDSLHSSSSSSTSYLSRSAPPTRILRLLPLLSYIHTTLYRHLFGRAADSLEKSTDNEDEYMLGDNNPTLTRSINVPREMSQLCCMAFVAGIVEAFMDGMGFPARVTAHNVPTDQFPRKCIILIKLDRSVMEREAAF
ncbi:TRAPP I complex [Atractiella rhizophila]|nr:TRAPP I complex [Atractiella rhizophila]